MRAECKAAGCSLGDQMPDITLTPVGTVRSSRPGAVYCTVWVEA